MRVTFEGIGDDMDGVLDFMDEEKILDPFLQWLGWFTDIVVEKEETADSDESEESRSIVRERNDVIKQALIPTLVNIIRHARMQEHGKGQATEKTIAEVGNRLDMILFISGHR